MGTLLISANLHKIVNVFSHAEIASWPSCLDLEILFAYSHDISRWSTRRHIAPGNMPRKQNSSFRPFRWKSPSLLNVSSEEYQFRYMIAYVTMNDSDNGWLNE